MENIKTFESWYAQVTKIIQESAEASPAPIAPTVTSTTAPVKSTISTAKKEIIGDVDSIMTTLSKLSVQVKEAVESLDMFETEEVIEELNEDEESLLEKGEQSTGGKAADWLFYAPKYRNMQKKINKMKMNMLDVQLAVDLLPDDAENKAKKNALKAKKVNMKDGISDLQTSVDDKAKERGEYIQRVLSAEKIKGRMELVKRASGQEDDPSKKKDMMDSFKELNARFAEEQAALKQLQDEEKKKDAPETEPTQADDKEQKTDKEREQEEADAQRQKEEEAEALRKKEEAEAEAQRKKEEEAVKDSEKDPEKEDPAKDPEKEDPAKDTEKEDPAKDPEKEDPIDKEIADVQDRIKAINDKAKDKNSPLANPEVLAAAIKQEEEALQKLKDKKASAKESLMSSAVELELNELAYEISTKEGWQLENNSPLYLKYKREIDKNTADKKINESGAISIADKLRLLLG